MYLGTYCNIGDEDSVFQLRTQQVTQLFTYLLTHKLFSSGIRRYPVSRACDWVIPALSAVLLTFSFQLPDQKTTKFRLPLKLSLLRGSRPKSARASSRQCAHGAPDFIQIGSLSAQLWQNAWTPFFCPVEYLHYRLFESILSSWNSLKRYLDAEDRSYKRDTVGWGSWRRSARARVSSPSLLATSSISWRSLTLSDDDYALCRPTAAAAAATTTDGATSSPLHNASTASPPTPTLSRRHVLAILTHRVPKMSTRF